MKSDLKVHVEQYQILYDMVAAAREQMRATAAPTQGNVC